MRFVRELVVTCYIPAECSTQKLPAIGQSEQPS
jgi:hypothetical protein